MRRFGFTVTGSVAHLMKLEDTDRALCGAKMFYFRDGDSRDYPICKPCKEQNDEGQRPNLLPDEDL